jgi:cytochrome c-type biogenesis protein
MNIFTAFFGGFASFFSSWIYCLLQVIPFFIAFGIGTLAYENRDDPSAYWRKVLWISVFPFIGFLVVFVATGMSTTAVSKTIFLYIDILNQAGGVVIGLAGLYFTGLLTLDDSNKPKIEKLYIGWGILLGASLAFAYKPCVTPTLTKVLMLNNSTETAGIGAAMLIFYTLGVSTAIIGAELILIRLVNGVDSLQVKKIIRKACGGILLIASILILSGHMTEYKSFLVGRFVPAIDHNVDHSTHGNDMKQEGM